jgi:26S proteasome regulatory subunit N8
MASAPTSKPPLVVIHPLVLISVVDHYNRIMTKTQQPRVVGALLGKFLN